MKGSALHCCMVATVDLLLEEAKEENISRVIDPYCKRKHFNVVL